MGLDVKQQQPLCSSKKQDDNVLATLSMSACIKLPLATFVKEISRDSRGTEEPLNETDGQLLLLSLVVSVLVHWI